MSFSNVVCFVLHGLLVTAFPTGDFECDGVDLGLLGVPVEGTVEYSGTATASGYCSIVGHTPYTDPLPVTSPIVTPANIVSESDDATAYDTTVNDENLVPNAEYDEAANRKIPNKVILGALIADAIMREKGAEVDATLAELDAFVEAEIGTLGPLIQNALTNADTSEVDRCVDSALFEIESKIASELAMIDAFIDSELIRTENLVKSVTDYADRVGSLFTLATCPNETTEMENANMTEKEALIAMTLATLESIVESQLAKAEAIIDAELEKVNTFVESELAKVDGIVESELAKVNLFVETELAKTDAHVKSELSKMESFVDIELAKVDPMEGTVDFSDGYATNDDSSSCPSVSFHPNLIDERTTDGSVYVSGTFPLSGRTLILENTGCPPIIPTYEPLPLHVESFPVFETHDYYDDPYGEEFEEVLYDSVTEIPIAGEPVFSGVAPAEGSCRMFGGDSLPSMNRNHASPPMVGEATPIITKQVTESCNEGCFTLPECMQKTGPGKPQLKILPTVNVGGNVNFSGTARATGSTSLFTHFPCAPLTATEIGPDGKKYIWISKKPSKSVPPRAPSRPRTDFPVYTEDFPEIIIVDSTKNYEKLMNEDLNVDFGVLGPVTVAGDAFFEGAVPAFGSVSIKGHSA